MPELQLAVATRHFGLPLQRTLDAAVEIGARGLQFDVRNELKPSELSDTGRRAFKNRLREQLLTLASFEYPTRRSFCDEEALDARVAGLKGALEFAFSMGVTVVCGRIGRIPEDADSPKYRLLREVLNDIARHSNRVGATFAITPGVDSLDAIKRVLSDVTDGPIGINLDPAGLIMSENDPVEVYRGVYDRVLSVQLRDGLRDIDGQGIEVPVGRGEVVWDELLALLEEGSFRGWLVASRTTGDDKLGDMARALRFVRNLRAGL
ncbi:MAG: sugar phosphate isomerase/epimerase family protein [Planctomycetota bacterium]|jgi:sugar phosphate isomerase/epimerase